MPRLLSAASRALRAHRRNPVVSLRDDSGQSLIELAVVLPLFFMMVIGFINFCMVMFGLCSISYACRQAARYASLHSSASQSPVTQSTIDAQVARFVLKYPSNTYSDTLTYTGSGNVVGGNGDCQSQNHLYHRRSFRYDSRYCVLLNCVWHNHPVTAPVDRAPGANRLRPSPQVSRRRTAWSDLRVSHCKISDAARVPSRTTNRKAL